MKPKVLFVCTGNAARSQMAEGYLRFALPNEYEALSAGIVAKALNPLAVEAMREIGIDISKQQSKDVASLLGQPIPYVVTVCDNAKEHCPVFPGTSKLRHWSLEDPSAVEGRHDKKLAAFRNVRDQIVERIDREFVQHRADRKRD
ncbi:MAG: arsenate reductase ArsC [Acidobacteriales bacterium]|nr:arsenate reductase ArsC [Terriglobales bacterium]